MLLCSLLGAVTVLRCTCNTAHHYCLKLGCYFINFEFGDFSTFRSWIDEVIETIASSHRKVTRLARQTLIFTTAKPLVCPFFDPKFLLHFKVWHREFHLLGILV